MHDAYLWKRTSSDAFGVPINAHELPDTDCYMVVKHYSITGVIFAVYAGVIYSITA